MKTRLSSGAFLAAVIVASSAWLAIYARGAPAREASKVMQKQVEHGFFSGTVLVSRGGKVLFEHAYGMANAEEKIPNTLETRFRIASVTKIFTAIMVMQLEAEHRLTLSDSVCMYLDECPTGWAQIKLHHLLSHTSGIYDYTRPKSGEAGIEAKLASRPAQGEDFARFLHEPPAFAPGERFEYSNSNYRLLAHVIGKVTGQSYEAALRQRILEPADMRDSSLTHDWATTPNAAVGYWMTRHGKLERAPVVNGGWSSGDGGIYSTVLDLEKFSEALDSGKLIPRATLRRMQTPVRPEYGYGWSTPPVSKITINRRQVNHSGSLPGFLSQFQRFEDEKLTVIVLANSQRSNPSQVAQALGSAAFDEPFTPSFERPSVEVPAAVLKRYEGDYDFEGRVFTLSVRAGHLYARLKGMEDVPEMELLPAAEDVFFFKQSETETAIVQNAGGEVTGLAVTVGDVTRYARKVR